MHNFMVMMDYIICAYLRAFNLIIKHLQTNFLSKSYPSFYLFYDNSSIIFLHASCIIPTSTEKEI